MICRDCKFLKRMADVQPDGHCLKYQEPTWRQSQRLCFEWPAHPMDGVLAGGKRYHLVVTPLLNNTRVTMVVRTPLGPVAGGFLIPKEKWDPNNFAQFFEFMETL